MSDPIRTYYLKGWDDAKDPTRKRMRAVPFNFKLAYTNGWYDAKMNRACRYD